MTRLLVPSQVNGVPKLMKTQRGSPVVGMVKFKVPNDVRPVSKVVVNVVAVVCFMATLKLFSVPENVLPTANTAKPREVILSLAWYPKAVSSAAVNKSWCLLPP